MTDDPHGPPRLDDLHALEVTPENAPVSPSAHAKWKTWGALGLGLAYGLVARFLFGLDTTDDWLGVMTLGFIFVVPFVIGFATVYTLPDPPTWGKAMFAPVIPVLLTLLGSLLLAWEGLICIVVWLPVAVLLAMAGGGIAGLVRHIDGRRRSTILASMAVLPLVVAPIEAQFKDPERQRVVEDRIVIDAPVPIVWDQIREVPAIGADELAPSFAHGIGFPRPIEARLEGTGVGSVRYATFEGGVTFLERVTDWEEGRELAFTIDAGDVPPTTFDTHVAVGGRYFDVLEGRYTIHPLGDGRIELALSSTHRLSTRFNVYTRIWTDLFMRDIQQNILRVIRDRSEAAASLDATVG